MADGHQFSSPASQWLQRPQEPSRYILKRAFTTNTYSTTPSPWANRSVWIMIGLNAGVFGYWQYAHANKDRKLQAQLTDNFCLSEGNIKAGRYWTLITSAFSHQDPAHFVFNMFALRAFGGIIASVPGVRALHIWSLALGSAMFGSLGWLSHQRKPSQPKVEQKQTIWDRLGAGRQRIIEIHYALGASGVAMGMGAAATCLAPFTSMHLMFIPIPIPLWIITAGYVALDTYYLDNKKDRIGHAAHLGGAIYGFLFYFGYFRRLGGIWRMLRR